jgi:succinyl-diaminopimelate desuccinylase
MPAVQTPPADRFVTCVREVAASLLGETRPPGGVPYYTDGAVLAPTFQAPLVICGPGEPSQLHQTDEWIRLRRLGEATRLYAEVAAAWLG